MKNIERKKIGTVVTIQKTKRRSKMNNMIKSISAPKTKNWESIRLGKKSEVRCLTGGLI
jgi:hypothetical protein